MQISRDFADAIRTTPFVRRRDALVRKAVRVDLVQLGEADVGYCITTIDDEGVGEVESLFVEKEHRNRGLGDRLMRQALGWLDERGVERRIIGVVVGNERAIRFYQRYGFRARTTILAKSANGSA